MSSDSSIAVAKSMLTPLPQTERGFGIHLDATKKGDRICYANGNHVIVRSLEDPSQGDVFAEHKCRVHVARFSPNGEWIASGDERGRVMVWAVKSKIVKITVPIGRKVLDISWSGDGKRIVAAGDGAEQRAKAFSWDSGNNLGQVAGHSKTILSCDFKKQRPFRVATCAEDQQVNFYTGPPFKFTSSFKGHSRWPNCVRFSPDGSKLISVGADSKIFVFDGKTGEKTGEIESKDDGHKGNISSFSWSPDGKQILTSSLDKTAKIWNVEDGTVAQTFRFGGDKPQIEDQQVSTLWHKDYLLSVSLSGQINYLDVANPDKPKRVIQGHQADINGAALIRNADNNTLFTVCSQGRLSEWDLSTGNATWWGGVGHKGPIADVAAAHDGSLIATVGLDDTLIISESKEQEFGNVRIALGGQPTSVTAANKEAGLFAVTTTKGAVRLVRADGSDAGQATVSDKGTCSAFSQDDSLLAVGTADRQVVLFSVADGKLEEKAKMAEGKVKGAICSIHFSSDGKWLVSTDKGRFIAVWDLANGYELKTPYGLTYHNAQVTASASSPSGALMATGAQDQNVIVWQDLVKFKASKRQTLEVAHTLGVSFVAFLSDDEVISIGKDRVIKTWAVVMKE